ncbi:uncharacterized protein M6B38_290430 [Iris pallida]|uniref:SANTA domain-containing protein n=1 Tax=Iris pallida TaxID=29817 RepID=A0AAX6HVG7_IRIPA|nr:uncharacterized protein M6B38_290430 [Iris pallida]
MVHKKTPNSHAKEPGSSHPSTTPAIASSPWKSTPATPFTPSSSSFEKTVILFDWWLFEAETDVDGKRLAVGGLTMRGQQKQQATRVFNSAPIIKRFDAFTVETADGITVRIHGSINKSRTHHNGVPVEVCNCFLIGFPYNWEVYADEYFGNKPSSTFTSKTAHCVDEQPKASSDGSCGIFPIRLDEFPMSKIIDVINSTPGTSIDDLLKKSFTRMSKGNLDDEQTTNPAEFEIRRLSNDVLPEENFISFPTTGSKFGGYTLRSRCRAERTQVHSTGVAEGKDLDKKVSKSFSVKVNEPSAAFLESDVRKPQDVSNGKDHGHTRSKFSSKKDKTAVLPSAVSPDEDQYHAEVERMGVDNKKASIIESSGDPKGPLSNDIDEVCNRIHEKLDKCTFIARKDTNTQVAAVATEKRTSEMGEVLLKKPLTKSTVSRRKYGAERQKNIQHKTDGIESVMPAHHSDKDTAHSNIPINEHCRTDEASGMIEKDTAEEHTYRKEIQSEDLDGVQQMIKNKASYTRGRTIWKPSYSPVLKTPLTRDMANKSSISSPELLNLRRSRSGRLLVPSIDHWRQKIIYDMDRNMVGITGVDNLNSPTKGSKSLPPSKKRKKL